MSWYVFKCQSLQLRQIVFLNLQIFWLDFFYYYKGKVWIQKHWWQFSHNLLAKVQVRYHNKKKKGTTALAQCPITVGTWLMVGALNKGPPLNVEIEFYKFCTFSLFFYYYYFKNNMKHLSILLVSLFNFHSLKHASAALHVEGIKSLDLSYSKINLEQIPNWVTGYSFLYLRFKYL